MTIVETRPITGGVDTHLDVHVAAALDANGGLLGVESFPTTTAGFAELYAWLCSFGTLERVGVEGTGAYGAGLARSLRAAGVAVVEVDRPNRQARRRHGKSDTVDAVEAARAALSGRAAGVAKTADGNVEAIRALLVAHRSGSEARIKCLNQIRHLGFTAPDELRERCSDRSGPMELARRSPPCHYRRVGRRGPAVPDIAESFGPEGRASSTTLNRRPEMSTGSIRTKRGFGAACHENNGSSTASNRSCICSISTAWPLTTTLHASPLAWS